MKIVSDFNIFIDESYLESNFAPLYHFTTYWLLESILEDNILKTGWIKNTVFGESINIISFTRNEKMDISNYKNDLDIIICIDKNKLIKDGYKFYPYDFFINNKKETYHKSNIKRNKPYEFEEALKKDIKNILNYIVYVDFLNNSLYNSYKSVNILKDKNIQINENGRRLL